MDVSGSEESKNLWFQPMIIGIVVGSLLMFLFLLLFSYFYCTRQKKRSKKRVYPINIPSLLSPTPPSSTIPEQFSNELPPIIEEEIN